MSRGAPTELEPRRSLLRKISGILEKAKAHRVPKKAPEEPKPLSFATPNP